MLAQFKDVKVCDLSYPNFKILFTTISAPNILKKMNSEKSQEEYVEHFPNRNNDSYNCC